MSVKLLLLKSGEQVIADVKEMLVGDEESPKVVGYFLNKPCVVNIRIPGRNSPSDAEKNNIQTRPIFTGNALRHPAFSSLVSKRNKLSSFKNADYNTRSDQLFSDRFRAIWYYSIKSISNNNTIYSASFYASSSTSLSDDDARITKRVFIPSKKLRGFEPGKIGPKDGNDYIGGNFGTAFNLTSTLPRLFTEVQDLDMSLFFDAANVWGVDYSSLIDDNSKIRSSIGLALDWFTPIGPLSFSLASPITKSSTDETETFRFRIGTTF